MPILNIDQVKAHLGFTDDIEDADDVLLDQKIMAAEAYLDSALGYRLADRYSDEPFGPTPYPADLVEAALQLIANWYEARDAGEDLLKREPFSVSHAIQAHREWTF